MTKTSILIGAASALALALPAFAQTTAVAPPAAGPLPTVPGFRDARCARSSTAGDHG